jgi:uncharacterized membrane protein YgcG
MAKVILTSKTSAMKSKSTLSIVSLAVLFVSCTTAYKSGQTPDDVYYSPARPQAEYVTQEKREDKMYRYDEGSYRDDRYLRMKINDPRYDLLYDDYYSYNPYYYHYYNGNLLFNSPWSTCSYWNYYYNPYYSHVISVVPRTAVYALTPVYNKPRTFDLSVYNPQSNNNTYSSKSVNHGYSPNYYTPNTNNYRNSGRDAGGFLRDVFSGSSNNNSSNSGSRSTSSGSSSGGSSGGSSNAPARRF